MGDGKTQQEKQIEQIVSRFMHSHTRSILVGAIVIIVIVLSLSYGFVDYPRSSVQIFSYDRDFADAPSNVSYFADQLKFQSTMGDSLSFHVVDWTNDISQWLLYHKNQLIIQVTISTTPMVRYPVLAVFILDNEGLIRGYKLIDLLDFADTRATRSPYGTNVMPGSLNVNVTLTYYPPSDVKSMRLWLVLYSLTPDNYGFLGIIDDPKYQHVVNPNYRQVLCSQDLEYTYVSYQDLAWRVIGSIGFITLVLGFVLGLSRVKRIRKTHPV